MTNAASRSHHPSSTARPTPSGFPPIRVWCSRVITCCLHLTQTVPRALLRRSISVSRFNAADRAGGTGLRLVEEPQERLRRHDELVPVSAIQASGDWALTGLVGHDRRHPHV